MKYDFLVVGAGLYGAVFAEQKTRQGYKCLIVEKRNHIAGNAFSKKIEGIEVHEYGPHIFHTDKENVWKYVNRFAEFNNFIYQPIANYKGKLYHLPFNMNTFYDMWEVKTPKEAETKIASQRDKYVNINPSNLEEQALKLVGTDIYEKLIKGYTEKQWGRECKELPQFIISRLPMRMTFDNNYFNHPYQGIPKQGYTQMVKNILGDIEVRLGVDFIENRKMLKKEAKKIIFTGPIDEYYEYKYGCLEYRSLSFETCILECPNYQGVAGVNYTDRETPYTRIIEHKHFLFGEGNDKKTVITREYPQKWVLGKEPYYPINDKKNDDVLKKYENRAKNDKEVWFGGRLGTYQYMNMDQVIHQALIDSQKKELNV